MGKCITIVKLVGIGSLGLCTASFISAATYCFPAAIEKSDSLDQIKSKLTGMIIRVRFTLYGLGSLASYLFYQVFTKSPAHGQHPYLIYSAIAVPAALIYGYYNVYAKEQAIINDGEERVVYRNEKRVVEKVRQPQEEQSPLDNSVYGDLGSKEPTIEHIEEEIEIPVIEKVPLTKDQLVVSINELKTQYLYSGAIVGAGFLMSVIGYLGDNM